MKYFLFIFLSGCVTTVCKNEWSGKKGELGNFCSIYNDQILKKIQKDNYFSIKNYFSRSGIDPNIQEKKYGMTLLQWAVKNKQLGATRALTEIGANACIPDYYCYTALNTAASYRHSSEFLELCLKNSGANGCNIDSCNKTYPTPLIAAARMSVENVKILTRKGADVNYKTIHGLTALESALALKRVRIVKYLLENTDVDVFQLFGKDVEGSDIYISNWLRLWDFPIPSEEYDMKMEIVIMLKRKGIKYRDSKIPIMIKKRHTQEYLGKY